MKFIVATAILSAGVDASLGLVCKSNEKVCADTECCGKATKDPNYKDGATNNFAKDGVIRTVCNHKDAKYWIESFTSANAALYFPAETKSGKAGYFFACNGSSALLSTLSVLSTMFLYQ